MSKYKIKEVRKTLVNGEVESVFYIYKPFLFFLRKYDERVISSWVGSYTKRNKFSSLDNALSRIIDLQEGDKVNSAEKVKKIETIIH